MNFHAKLNSKQLELLQITILKMSARHDKMVSTMTASMTQQ
jgi:hypothetical protein